MFILLSSRTFSVEIGGKNTNCLALLIDMFNHDIKKRSAAWKFNDEINYFTAVAVSDIKADDEVKYIEIDFF